MPQVAIVIGSPTDESYLEDARALLTEFGVEYEFRAVSAHRNPDATREFATTARDRGIEVIIAAAGMAGAEALLLDRHGTLSITATSS